jgi:hypothetical protein
MPGRFDRSRREHFVVGPQWVERTPDRRQLTDDMIVVWGATDGEVDRGGRGCWGKARAEADRTSCAVRYVLYCTVPVPYRMYRTVPHLPGDIPTIPITDPAGPYLALPCPTLLSLGSDMKASAWVALLPRPETADRRLTFPSPGKDRVPGACAVAVFDRLLQPDWCCADLSGSPMPGPPGMFSVSHLFRAPFAHAT